MIASAFDLGEALQLRIVEYRLYHPLWSRYDLSAIDLSLNNWTTIKYLNDDGTAFHDDIDSLPNDRGGLYMFFVKCPIIPGISEFPFYIGRAQHTEGQNLRKRCREYFTKFSREDERPKITRMFRYWAKDLYLSFIPLDDNTTTREYEKGLINSLLLPFNDEIPDQEIKQSISAFRT